VNVGDSVPELRVTPDRFLPEQEIRVSGTVTAADGDSATVDTVAEQSGNQIIKNAVAELRAV